MKKLALSLAIILGMTIGASAQDRGLFGKGPSGDETTYSTRGGESEGGLLKLPGSHDSTDDAPAPLGGGALLLIGFGAAYAMSKKRK